MDSKIGSSQLISSSIFTTFNFIFKWVGRLFLIVFLLTMCSMLVIGAGDVWFLGFSIILVGGIFIRSFLNSSKYVELRLTYEDEIIISNRKGVNIKTKITDIDQLYFTPFWSIIEFNEKRYKFIKPNKIFRWKRWVLLKKIASEIESKKI